MKLWWPWRARRAAREQELNREIEWHLNEIREEREADGLSPRQAVHAARREFGNVGIVQEDARAAWGWTLLEQCAQDLRYALRTMGANRLFTALAVASLALGIGANAAIYSFMDALLLRSLPVADPTGLVVMNWHANSSHKIFLRFFALEYISHRVPKGFEWRRTIAPRLNGPTLPNRCLRASSKP